MAADEGLRETFIAEVRKDPYAHMILFQFADAWADGYEQALRDHNMTEARLRKTYSDRRNEAVEHLTNRSNEAKMRAMIAFAEIGRLLHEKPHGT